MKILHVVNISFVIPFFLGKQLNYFSEKGNEEHIICSYSDELLKFSHQYNFKYKAFEIERKISISNDIKAVFKTIKYIKDNDIDIVTGHTPKGGFIAMLASFLARVPVRIYFRHGLVYETSHGLKRSLLKNIDRLASLLATKIVCVSPSVYKRSIADKLNSEKKQIILSKGTCNGIDVERFNQNSIDKIQINKLKKQYQIADEDFIIGFTGRLVRDKGIIELVEAFWKLKKEHPNIKLLLVGMLEKRDALPSDFVEKIKKDSSIIKTGYIDYSVIELYYSIMDIFVLPSYREGFPTSVLEASSMQIPVITTKVTGCIDSIIDKETGFFVKHEINELADKIHLLFNSKKMRMDMGKKGREFVVNNFRQEIIWKEIEKLYIK